MMVWTGGILVISGFLLFVKLFDLVGKGKRVISIATSTLEIVRDPDTDDKQKEIAMQTYAKELFILFILITVFSLLAITIPFGFIWLMEFAGLLVVDEVAKTAMSWEFIALTAAISAILFGVSKVKNSEQ